MAQKTDFDIGLAYFEQGNFGSALLSFEKCLKITPQEISVLMMVGRTLVQMEKLEQALTTYQNLLSFHPNYAEAHSEKGVVLFKMGKIEDSIQALSVALDLDPHNPYRYSSRAYIRAKTTDIFGAMDDYQKAIELDPDDMIALNNLGMLEESLGFSSHKARFERVDKLLGRDPKLPQSQVSEPKLEAEKTTEIPKKSEIDTPKTASEPQKPTYWSIIKETLTSAQTFREFITFVKNKFRK